MCLDSLTIRETVTYVGNIYKFYIAYRLIMEARAEREQASEKLKV
jgi:hypothetical protein